MVMVVMPSWVVVRIDCVILYSVRIEDSFVGLVVCLVSRWRSFMGEYEPRLRCQYWTEVMTLSCAGMYKQIPTNCNWSQSKQ